jgi:hypothetical protein
VQGWTVVGVGDQQGLLFRNGTGGHVSDALICNTSEGIEIEDKADEVIDAYDHFLNGDLTLMDIVVTGDVDAIDYDGGLEDGDAVLDTYAADNNITGDAPDGLDSNFDFDVNGAIAIDPLFLEVGVGSGQTWAYGWSFCDQRGMFATVASVDNAPAADFAASLFPNPSLNHATLALPTTHTSNVRIVTLKGAVAGTLNNVQGQVALPSDLTAGTYLVNVTGASTTQTLTWIKR